MVVELQSCTQADSSVHSMVLNPACSTEVRKESASIRKLSLPSSDHGIGHASWRRSGWQTSQMARRAPGARQRPMRANQVTLSRHVHLDMHGYRRLERRLAFER